MGILLGILIAFYLVFTQSVWIFERIFAFVIPVPYPMEASFALAALIAGGAAGWMAHRYEISEWRVGLLAGLVPIAAVVIGTTLIGELTTIMRETPLVRYLLLAGEVVLIAFACKLGALTRAKVRRRGRVKAPV